MHTGIRAVIFEAVAQTFPADQLTQADLIRPGIGDLGLPDLLGAA